VRVRGKELKKKDGVGIYSENGIEFVIALS